jgi:hypothetical protein
MGEVYDLSIKVLKMLLIKNCIDAVNDEALELLSTYLPQAERDGIVKLQKAAIARLNRIKDKQC